MKKKYTLPVKAISLIALAVITVFAAVSCAPPEVELGDFDWSAINEQNDPARNGGENIGGKTVAQLTPSAYWDDYTYSKDSSGNDTTTIVELEVYIVFPDNADVLRSEITKTALSFISFHSFTKATTALTEDKLGDEIPFEVERRTGNYVYVKLTTSINTASAYSDIVMKIDGKGYTFNGIRVDVDQNGKFEDVYDDLYVNITLPNGTGAKATGFVRPGQQTSNGFDIYLTPDINSVTTATASPSVGTFEFVGTATATTSNTLRIVNVGYSTNADAAIAKAWNDYYKDVGDTLARGIKLQKLSGESWTDVKTAEYVGKDDNANIQGRIVFKAITFDHLATYRIVWQGSAYTETANAYYGVKQRLYISNGYTAYNSSYPNDPYDKPAVRYTRTEVVGGASLTVVITDKEITPVNSNVDIFIGAGDNFGAKVSADSYDVDNRNVVVKIELTANNQYGRQFFWNSVSLDAFKKSFQIVYSLSGYVDYTAITTSNIINAKDLVYVDVQAISFKDELDPRPVAPAPSGDNVLYITIDPNFQFNNSLNIFFRINNDITITDKAASNPIKLTFGDANPLYENYAFYQASTWNGSYTPSLPNAPASAPANVSMVESADNEITLTWDAVTDATEYELSIDDVNFVSVGNVTQISDSDDPVSAGSYTIYVRAKNSVGSGPSASASIVILTGSKWKDDDDNTIEFTSREEFEYTPDGGSAQSGSYTVDGSGNVTFTGSSGDTLENETATVDFSTEGAETLTLSDGTTVFSLEDDD